MVTVPLKMAIRSRVPHSGLIVACNVLTFGPQGMSVDTVTDYGLWRTANIIIELGARYYLGETCKNGILTQLFIYPVLCCAQNPRASPMKLVRAAVDTCVHCA